MCMPGSSVATRCPGPGGDHGRRAGPLVRHSVVEVVPKQRAEGTEAAQRQLDAHTPTQIVIARGIGGRLELPFHDAYRHPADLLGDSGGHRRGVLDEDPYRQFVEELAVRLPHAEPHAALPCWYACYGCRAPRPPTR